MMATVVVTASKFEREEGTTNVEHFEGLVGILNINMSRVAKILVC